MQKKINFIIFGGTGDLTYRKLMPALYNLYCSNNDKEINIIAIGRREYDQSNYLEIIKKWIKKYSRIKYNDNNFIEFSKTIKYQKLDFTNIDEYQILSDYTSVNQISENIFYFAVAPRFFDIISKGISKIKSDKLTKLIIEKPFGETLEEAKKLNSNLENWFGKENIFHIDHYLGKEMIQNLLTVRFANPIFAGIWNNEYIECINIIASEEEGVGTRAGYYDQSGALKDMVQNHLMQIMSIVAMEEFDHENEIKSKQIEVLKKIKKIDEENVENHVVLGQYEGYKKEENIDENSSTETLAFCKMYIDNKRWENVPFYILTGKAMQNRELNVIITFKQINEEKPNVLTFKIQPLEGVSLSFNVKDSSKKKENLNIDMDFYQETIPSYQINTPEAYERLIISSIDNDHSWFANWDQIETSWNYIDLLKENYIKKELDLLIYKKDNDFLESFNKVLDNKNHFIKTSQLHCVLKKGE